MLKKITLAIIAILLMMNMRVIYAAQNTTNNEVSMQNTQVTENTVSNEEETSNEPTEDSAQKPMSKVVEAKAIVTEAGEVKKVSNGSFEDTIQTIKLKILNGEYQGKEFSTDYVLSYDVEGKILAYELSKGNKVTVHITEDSNGNSSVTIDDIQRAGYVYTIFIFFLISIIVIGGKQGIKAALSLIITMLALYFILIKLIFAGVNVILATIITSFIIIAMTFIITNGLNKKTYTAIIASFAGTLIAGALVIVLGFLAKLSGANEEAIQISSNLKTISFNFRELIFACIVVSSIGACMDICISIVNNLDDVINKTQDFSLLELFKTGIKIGRENIGTMSNTLILVYAGGLIKLILLYMACNMRIGNIISKETFAEQMISAMAGSIGVVFTIPLTAFAYSIINRKKSIYKTVSDNKIEGKRSLKI